MHQPDNQINIKAFILTSLVIFGVIYLTDYIAANLILPSSLQSVVAMFRGYGAGAFFSFLTVLSQLVLAFAFVYLFITHYRAKGEFSGEGLGFYTAVVLSTLDLYAYSLMKVPFALCITLVIGNFVKMIISGLLAAMIYND